MTARLPTQLTTFTGAPLPLPAMPQDRLLTVNIEQIPLFKDILGVPGIHIKPLRLDAGRVEWVFMPVCAPGCSLPLHYHTGPAQVYTLSGRWCYREYPDQPQTAGSYLYEPVGSVHTFYCPEDNTEDTVVIAWLEGARGGFCFVRAGRLGAHLLLPGRQHRRHGRHRLARRRAGQLQRRRHVPLAHRRGPGPAPDRNRGGSARDGPGRLHPRPRRRR